MSHARGPAGVVLASLLALGLAPAISACSETATSESTGQYVDDSAITAKVKAALIRDQSLKAFDIHVDTYKNIVQLSGFVNSQELSTRAAEVASRIEGVRAVKNDLIVK